MLEYEYGNDAIHIIGLEQVYFDRQGWPDIQHLHSCFGCAAKAQIETERRCKHEVSPSLAYVHQPIPGEASCSVEFEDVEENNVGERFDCQTWRNMVCTTLLSAPE